MIVKYTLEWDCVTGGPSWRGFSGCAVEGVNARISAENTNGGARCDAAPAPLPL